MHLQLSSSSFYFFAVCKKRRQRAASSAVASENVIEITVEVDSQKEKKSIYLYRNVYAYTQSKLGMGKRNSKY